MIENLIDGRFQVVQAASIPVLNPSTGEKIADCFETPASEVERAIASARSAQPAWARRPAIERARILHRVAEGMENMGSTTSPRLGSSTCNSRRS